MEATKLKCEQENKMPFEVNFNNFFLSWPPTSDKLKMILMEYGPIQGQEIDFRVSVSNNGQRFSKDWSF